LLDGVLLLWFILTAGSVLFTAWDLSTNTPTPGVMKAAWLLIMLYTGPVGLFVYLLSCRQPLPGTHDRFIAAHWKQSIGSMAHCVAGDATGIILSAAILARFHLPSGWELLFEYLSAFAVGLFVFQALFMRDMYGGNYWLAVRRTFFAETVSMNMVMFGMIPAMVLLKHFTPGSGEPTSPRFWGVMSAATLVGAVTAYPINSWLVRRGFKHGMMTASAPAMPGMAMAAPAAVSSEPAHSMPPPSAKVVLTATAATLAALLVAVGVTAYFVPLTF